MRLPKSIVILGHKVAIKYVDEAIEYEGRTLFGFYDSTEKVIVVNRNKDERVVWETLIHEFGHALFDLAGINQSNTSWDVQEILVEQFSRFIHANFKLRTEKCRK